MALCLFANTRASRLTDQLYFCDTPTQLPGEFTRFDFPPGVPAPFNFLWSILTCVCMPRRTKAALA